MFLQIAKTSAVGFTACKTSLLLLAPLIPLMGTNATNVLQLTELIHFSFCWQLMESGVSHKAPIPLYLRH